MSELYATDAQAQNYWAEYRQKGAALLAGASILFGTVACTESGTSVSENPGCVAGASFRGDAILGEDFFNQGEMVGTGMVQGSDLRTALLTLPKSYQTAGNQVADNAEGSDILDGYVEGSDPKELADSMQAAESHLLDKKVRGQLQTVLNSEEAKYSVDSVAYSDVSGYKTALGEAAQITNLKLQEATERALLAKFLSADTYLPSEYEPQTQTDPSVEAAIKADKQLAPVVASIRRAASAENDDAYYAATQKIDDIAQSRSDSIDSMVVPSYDVEQDMQKAAQTISTQALVAIDNTIKTHNALAGGPAVADKMNVAIKQNRTIDLSKLSGESLCVAPNGKGDPLMHSYASLAVKQGKLQLVFAESARSQMSQADQATMQATIGRLRPWLEAAYSNGEVLSTHFVLVDGGGSGPYYDPSTREVFIMFDPSEKLSVDELQSTITHEFTHAMTSPTLHDANSKTQEKLRDTFVAACGKLHQVDNDKGLAYTIDSSVVSSVIQEASPAYRPVLEAFKTGTVGKKTLQQVLEAYVKDLDSGCFNIGFGDALAAVVTELKLDKIDLNAMFTDLNSTADAKKMVESWNAAIRDGMFAQVNESNFVDTQSDLKPYLGHSEDNSDELAATTMDDAVNFTKKYITELKHANPAARKLQLAVLAGDVAIVSQANPSLNKFLNSTLAKIKKQVG